MGEKKTHAQLEFPFVITIAQDRMQALQRKIHDLIDPKNTPKNTIDTTEMRAQYVSMRDHLLQLLELQDIKIVFETLYHISLSNPALIDFLQEQPRGFHWTKEDVQILQQLNQVSPDILQKIITRVKNKEPNHIFDCIRDIHEEAIRAQGIMDQQHARVE